MDAITLPLFPEGTLATSVTVTVWVGVWVVVFYNLRFGWTLSGLVVPGYLVPLLIVKPLSAAVVVVEAVLTYLVVWAVSERPFWRDRWSSFFGRDRFFAIVVVSVLVRAVMDGWLLAWLGDHFNNLFGLDLDYRKHLHSYGLIVVALTANHFWKPGLRRGFLPFVVTVATTYGLVQYVLLEFTNFNLGSLQYLYEDIASSLLASPKAYVILITTALLVSWVNLRYGWEFSGILIPALLALQWYDPFKILVSFVEAGVILVTATLLLKLPLWRRTTMQGARKTLLFFNISFAYRLFLGTVVPSWFPDVSVSDFYGFGFLLSTLLAIRAHDAQIAVRMVRTCLEISLVGAVGGSLLGFLLTMVPSHWVQSMGRPVSKHAVEAGPLPGLLVDVVRADKLTFYQKRIPNTFVQPLPGDLAICSDGLTELRNYSRSRQPDQLARASALLAGVNYGVHIVEDRYLYLRELSPAQGWGVYVLDLQQPDGCILAAPAPLDEWATAEVALTLFRELEAGGLAIAGASRRTNTDGSADVLANPGSIFSVFHRVFGRGNVVHVRGARQRSLSKLADVRGGDVAEASCFWVKGAVPHRFSLRNLERLIPDYEIHWGSADFRNVIRDGTWSGIGELYLSRHDRRKLLSQLTLTVDQATHQTGLQREKGHLASWLLARKAEVAERGSNLYVPAKMQEMLYFDEEILKPILAIAQHARTGLSDAQRQELGAASAAASVLGYRLLEFHDLNSGDCFLILAEEPRPLQRRYWGTFVFRLGMESPHIVQVPRPAHERNTLEYGISLLERVDASALLVAGAHCRANLDGTSDIVRIANKVNLFHLVHQLFLRELGPRPMLIVQVRAIRAPGPADIVFATDDGTSQRERLSSLKRAFIDTIQTDTLTSLFVDGTPATAGYELGSTAQAMLMNQSQSKEMMSLWLSPNLRMAYTQQASNKLQEAQCVALGIPTVQAGLYEYVRDLGCDDSQGELPSGLRQTLTNYLTTRDVVAWDKAQKDASHFTLTRVIDRTSQQAFLVIVSPNPAALPHVLSLTETAGRQPRRLVIPSWERERVRQFVESRATWLEVTGKP